MDYLLCGNLPYPAWKKHISVQNLSNRRIRRYLVCRLKRPEARDFSHVRFTQNELNKYFKNEMLMQIKSCVSKFLLLYENEFIGIGAYAGEISEAIQPQINETVSKYGLRCVNFAISYMEPDQTKYDAIDEAQIERIKREKQGIGENAFMNQLGSNWDKMKRASIIETLAQNEGAGNITAMGAGLGMAMGVGSTIGNMANQVFQNASETQNMQSYEDPIVVLEKLKKLLAAGLITEEDYDTKKKEVLSRM